MALPPEAQPTPTPFPIAHLRLQETIEGHFRPAAHIVLSPSLIASNLIAQLSADDTQSLLVLLAHISPNGRISATAAQVASSLGIHDGQAERRLQKLTKLAWQGEPMARAINHESGYTTYVPSDRLVSGAEDFVFVPHADALARRPQIIQALSGAKVIAHTREQYTSPRDRVEEQLAEQNDWPLPSNPNHTVKMTRLAPSEGNKRLAWDLLVRLGVKKERASELVEQYPTERIVQQVAWLPQRRPRSPARLIIAAIAQDFEEPA
jgi:hypothetical protein